jgi:hypothetical protein
MEVVMFRKIVMGVPAMVLAAALILLPVRAVAQEAAGQNFVLVNFIGQEVTLDLDDVTYTVPGTDTMPAGGQFAMQLAPGMHKYAVTVPGGPAGASGEFVIDSGVVAKALRLEKTGPTLDAAGLVVEGPRDYVFVFDFDPAAPPAVDVPPAPVWQPLAASAGMGSLVWINYGGSDEVTIDMAGQIYKVPPQANNIPGRLQFDVAPGLYRYTVSVPYGSLNGEFTAAAGQVLGLNVAPGIREEPVYEVGEKVEIPPVELAVFEEDLTALAAAQPDAPAEQAAAPADAPAQPNAAEAAPAQAEGVVIKNFAGDTLVFTINNQAYLIADHAEQTLPVLPGRYTYTASVPSAAASGTVQYEAGQRVEVSIAINVNRTVLSVYQSQ